MRVPLTAVVVAAAVAISWFRGGRLRRLADVPLHLTWLLVLGLVLQVGVDAMAAHGVVTGALATAGLLTSQALVVGWVAANRYLPGVPMVLIGLLLNATVIAANGAMPVDAAAVAAVGGPPVDARGKHELLTEATRLPVLADTIALPPLRTVVSVGDIVLTAGLIPLVHGLMTYRPPAERRGGRRWASRGA